MSRRTASLAALIASAGLGLSAVPAAAQTHSEPHLVMSIEGGIATGSSLWSIPKQPIIPLGAEGSNPPLYDTLNLGRDVVASLVLGAGVTYFPGQHFGIGGEIQFQSFSTEDHCEITYETPVFPGGTRVDAQVCNYVNGHSDALSTLRFSAHAVYRVWSHNAVTPYARIGAGIATRTRSTVEVTGQFTDLSTGLPYTLALITDRNHASIFPAASLAAGVMLNLGPGYVGRFEIRDETATIEIPDGPANPVTEIAPKHSTWKHNFVISFALDIVLEHKRGHRY